MPAPREHVKTIFGQAAEIAAADERSRFLDEACSGDPALRAEVEDLLASMDQAGDFLVPCHFTDQTIDSQRPERPGTKIGPYKLLQQIGEGGMGVVYMAEQTQPVERRVALKIIKPGMDSRQVVARFEAERQALAMMDHPNIAKVLDAGTTDSGRPYFVMELVKGVPITKYCDEKRLSLRQRLELMIPVCQAIQHAHQKGIIHRDIKPTNVLIAQYDGKPVPKVIDFGVAKATAQKLTERTMFTELGQVVGTLEYMSPEQAELNQLDIDTRSDIYSLGVLLYELLTGSTPFDKQKLRTAAFHEMLRIIREDEPPKPSIRLSTIETLPSVAANRSVEAARLSNSVKGELDWIVMKSLDKDRSRRYETANAFALDLQRYLSDETVVACPPSATYRFRKFARKHRAALSTATLLATTLLLGTVLSTQQAIRASRAEAAAKANEIRAIQQQQAADTEAATARQAERKALAAAAAERKAKQAEADQRLRAEKGEKQAKDAAAKAAKAEAAAKQSAAEQTAVWNFFRDKVLAAGRPEGQDGGLGRDVTLQQAVDAAEPAVAAAFKDNPLVEARVRETLALTYREVGEPERSLKQAQRELELKEANLPAGSEATLIAMAHVGSAYLATGKPDQALPVLEEAFNLAKSKLGSEQRATLLCMAVLANAYHDVGKFDQALQLSEERLRIERKLNPEHPQMLVAMNNLAVAYSAAGNPEQAIKPLEEVVALHRANLGPKHPQTLGAQLNLGTCYLDAGKIDQALAIFQESVEICTAVLGQEHPQTLHAMAKLGNAYLHAGKIDVALHLLEQALNLTRAKLGPEHLHTLWAMGILANAIGTRRPDEALRLCRETYELWKAKYGMDHPRTISSMHSLALALYDAGRPDEALPLMEEALNLGKAQRGGEHPNTLIETANLAVIYDALGDFNQAVVLSQELLKLKQAKLGKDHRATLTSMVSLGAFYFHMGKATEAIELAEVAITHQRSKLGSEHPETLHTLSNLAMSYEMAGNQERGLSMMQDAVKLKKSVLGNEHRLTLQSERDLARMYDTRGEYARADALFRELLPRLQSTHGTEHPWTLQASAMFASNLFHQAKYGEAEPLLRACLATNEKTRPDRWETFNAKSLLGGCFLGQSLDLRNNNPTAAQQKLAEAEPLLVAGYEGLKARAAKMPAHEKIHLTEALHRLIDLYTASNKPAEAAKWQAELDAQTAEQPK